METVRLDELIPDEQWDEEASIDVEFEKQWDRISKDARKRCKENPDKEPHTMSHPDIGLSVPRTVASLTLKLAEMKPKPKSKNLRKA